MTVVQAGCKKDKRCKHYEAPTDEPIGGGWVYCGAYCRKEGKYGAYLKHMTICPGKEVDAPVIADRIDL